jgi:hypothetical protein
MKNILITSVLFVSILILAGCGKDDGVCVSSTGKTITQDRGSEPFTTLSVYDNINLILTQDPSVNRVVVEAGENLIDGITSRIDSGKLVLRNENSCNWLRSFKVPVNVYLTFTKLDTLSFQAAGNITCTNDWTNNSVYVEVIEGSGQLDLKLQTYRSFFFVPGGTTLITATGTSDVTTIISSSFGPVHAENLVSKFTYISTYSPNDVFVSSSIDLQVEIGNIGNVYYRGDPANIQTELLSEGKLIRL